MEIIIRASNNPHGTVMLSSSIPITTSEGAVPIQLNIIRLDGLIGDLLVNFTTVPSSADQMDFSISESCKNIYSCIISSDNFYYEKALHYLFQLVKNISYFYKFHAKQK